MKNTFAPNRQKEYQPNTNTARTGLLLGRAVSDYVDKYKGTSDAFDLIDIAKTLFPDHYKIAKSEKRVFAKHLAKKKGSSK